MEGGELRENKQTNTIEAQNPIEFKPKQDKQPE
jgi:hypothetical protein